MGQALMEFMEQYLRLRKEERFEEGRKEGLKEGLKNGLKKGIQGMVKILRNLGYSDCEIKEIIKENYSFSEEEAMEYL